MYPDADTRAKFKYPLGGLMQLQHIVTHDQLLHPTMLDATGEECIIVIKNGAATGLKFGRTTGIESFLREYKGDAIHSTSREIAVYPRGLWADFTDVTYVSAYAFLEERIKKVFPHSYLFPTPNPNRA
ncbi:hypothetical protein FRB90_005682 [Tulasnella sp. 427]|nr:hypothetical protein FRB90_005682 [Tulasnella sp. 427]